MKGDSTAAATGESGNFNVILCSGCIKIRLSDQRWVALRDYAEGEIPSSVRFGICPPCLAKYAGVRS